MNDLPLVTAALQAMCPVKIEPKVYRISKFLRVVQDDSIPNQRCVLSNHKQIVGIIGKYDPWKQWVLFPEPQTVWSHDCLDAIRGELLRLNAPTKPAASWSNHGIDYSDGETQVSREDALAWREREAGRHEKQV